MNIAFFGTPYGLVYISRAKSREAKAVWVAIVVACFAFAIHMIADSYNEWQESPVSTTITTHPITELDFPTVTVCPPRGTNTALNHILEKVKDVNFTEEERQELLDLSKEVFIRIPNRKQANMISDLLTINNMRSIANRFAKIPQVDKDGIVTSFDVQGMLRTPGFGNVEYSGDFFHKSSKLHYVLDLPEDIAVVG